MDRRRVVALVAPFLVLPFAARLLVGPIGDAMASAAGDLSPASPAPSPFVGSNVDAPEEIAIGSARSPHRMDRVARAAPVASAKRPAPSADAGAPRSSTIVVPASVVERAILDRKATARDVTLDGKPFGAKLVNVSRYHAGLQDGDIVTEVGGTRVHSASELAQAGMAQIAAGATKLTGKILRGETTHDVVLELPKNPPPAN